MLTSVKWLINYLINELKKKLRYMGLVAMLIQLNCEPVGMMFHTVELDFMKDFVIHCEPH